MQKKNIRLTFAEVAENLAGKAVLISNPAAEIEQLSIDSRQLLQPNKSLFFAISGLRNNGHDYLSDLYKAGCRNFVVEKMPDLAQFEHSNFLLVDNSQRALQQLAAFWRHRFHFPIIGVTGSNGKTVVKEWLFQVLRPNFKIIRNPKSYNSQVGVPLSIWLLDKNYDLGIFEAGISKTGEMEALEKIISPTFGIFTNIGTAHNEGFKNISEKVAEKMRLFTHSTKLLFCADYKEIGEAAHFWQNEQQTQRSIISWSKTGEPADFEIFDIAADEKGVRVFKIRVAQTKMVFEAKIPFLDDASLENAIFIWCFCHHLGLDAAKIRERMAKLEPIEMRLELKAGINGCTLLNDFYNNDFSSLLIALNTAASYGKGKKLTLILSDILQSGEGSAAFYKQVADAIEAKKINRIIAIGSEIQILKEFLPSDIELDFYKQTSDFLQKISSFSFSDEFILLKGARPFEFEKIARRLEQKAHKTQLEVNLSALVHNLNVYARLTAAGTKMLVMVKAAAYGSGAVEVARLLEYHKVDYLGVAYPDEGIELREAGINLPILVLNAEEHSFDAMIRFRLEPEIYSHDILEKLIKNLPKDKKIGIHLKLDTGMRRLGFEPEEIEKLCDLQKKYPNLEVKSVFSHLAASDSAVHDDFTEHQVSLFLSGFEKIKNALGYAPIRHIVNTGGIPRFPKYHFDMVRLGIGIYGIEAGKLPEPLQVVNTLTATISQIKIIKPGETVGYNRSGKITKITRSATISIGYADGLLRLAGNARFWVVVRGKQAPTIGNICMDMCMVDVTEIREAQEGDEVIIFGAQNPVNNLAQALHTIPYEIFTGISERVKRVYWH